jgi:hypothetical protein
MSQIPTRMWQGINGGTAGEKASKFSCYHLRTAYVWAVSFKTTKTLHITHESVLLLRWHLNTIKKRQVIISHLFGFSHNKIRILFIACVYTLLDETMEEIKEPNVCLTMLVPLNASTNEKTSKRKWVGCQSNKQKSRFLLGNLDIGPVPFTPNKMEAIEGFWVEELVVWFKSKDHLRLLWW